MEKVQKFSYTLLKIASLLVFQCCNIEIQEIQTISSDKNFDYDIDNPGNKFLLENELKEISGLSFGEGYQFIYSINDEEGRIFVLDKEGGEIIEKIPFGKKGDYEGIELVENSIFVVKSSGTILELDTAKQDVKHKYNTSLKPSNDVEGLGYNKIDSSLLLACKAAAGIDKEIKDSRAIYKFDLANRKLQEEPFLLISDESIVSFIRKHAPKREHDLQRAYFKKLLKRAVYFSPSGIAVHPKTNEIYILSAVSKLLLVVDQSNNIKHFVFLKSKIFAQPEGICFAEDGDMIISNEGAKGAANIYTIRSLKKN
mgnify:CR=1 FL=1